MPIDPYNAIQLTRLVRVIGPNTFTSPAAGWNPLLDQNPARLWFVLSLFTSAGIARVWPTPLFADGGIASPNNGPAVLVTAWEYPGLCQGEWQYYDTGTNEWTLYEGWLSVPREE